MTISHIIREANSEHEIYFLLTAYIDAVQFADKLNCLSEHLTRLPLTGLEDVRGRSAKLVGELDAASKRLDDKVCTVIKEALEIFGAALTRLELFERLSPSPQGTALPMTALGDLVARDLAASGLDNFYSTGPTADMGSELRNLPEQSEVLGIGGCYFSAES